MKLCYPCISSAQNIDAGKKLKLTQGSQNTPNQRAIQSSEGLGRLVGWSQVGCWWRTMQEQSRYFCKPKDDFLPHTSQLSYQHMGNCNQPAERLLIRRKKHSHSNLLWSILELGHDPRDLLTFATVLSSEVCEPCTIRCTRLEGHGIISS